MQGYRSHHLYGKCSGGGGEEGVQQGVCTCAGGWLSNAGERGGVSVGCVSVQLCSTTGKIVPSLAVMSIPQIESLQIGKQNGSVPLTSCLLASSASLSLRGTRACSGEAMMRRAHRFSQRE